MTPCEIIMKKRRGQELNRSEIEAFVRGACDSSFADYQLSALLMAICIQGMSDRETVDLTMAMAHSGQCLDLTAIRGVTVDKHSTGGVGDTTTLIAAPLCAACGARVFKMSGRGLGFTGGTLDKLEAIPGMRIDLNAQELIEQVNAIGLAVTGQTASLAPADKKLYALRDVTATVDCMPLIVSSILSKKLAAGCGAVVLDVKTGSGAIMPTLEESIELAETMVRIGRGTGRSFSALVTDMDQPLGMNVGNALEVREAIEVLSGGAQGALREVSLRLSMQMLKSASLAQSDEQAADMLEEALRSGRALERLGDMIACQGGDKRVIYEWDRLPQARERRTVLARESGYVSSIEASAIGYAAQALGAGRTRVDQSVDPTVGVVMKKRIGDSIRRGEVWCEMHTGERSDEAAALKLLEGALHISQEKPMPRPLIHRVIE